VTNRSSVCEAQGRAEQCRLADAYSITGARVITLAGMTQEQENEEAAPDPSVWRGAWPRTAAPSSAADGDRWRTDKAAVVSWTKSCGMSWETKKKPVRGIRVPLTGRSLYLHGGDPCSWASACAGFCHLSAVAQAGTWIWSHGRHANRGPISLFCLFLVNSVY
jgi:hypothetical protein